MVTQLYVGGANCSDSGAGTASQPYCTINAAATAAVAGQTVIVAAGTYTEKVTVAHSGSSGSPIVFMPATGAAVTVTGAANGFAISGKHDVTITGFTITNTTSYGIYVSGSSNITISSNTVTHAGQPVSGQTAVGIYVSGTTASRVTGNTADYNSNHGIFLGSSTTTTMVDHNEASFNANGYQRNANGIDIIGTDNSAIANVVHDNEDSGLQFYTGGDNGLAALNVSYNNGDHGIDNLNVTGGRLIGNTIYHNCTSGINVEGTSGNYTVRNNISVDNAVYPAYNGISCSRRAGNIGIWDSAPATTTVDSNLVWLSTSGTQYVFGSAYTTLAAMKTATGQEAHGLQANPLFVNSASYDLQLSAGSPAIDSADSSASGEQAADIAGTPRVDTAATANTGIGTRTYDDRGAYEYTGGPTILPPNAALTVSPTNGTAPLLVTANASGSSDPQGQALSYTFAFGDGTTVGPQSQATASHTFTAVGNYTVTVTVTNTSGLTATASAPVTAQPSVFPPSAALAVSPSNGTAPLLVTANASGSSDPQGQALSYTFAFGDGTTVGPQSQATASHTFTAAGNYTVTVTVTNTSGLTATASAPVTVQSSGGGGSGNPAFVNQIATNSSTNAHTSGSITVWRPAGVQLNNLAILTLQLSGTSATGAVAATDSGGNTYTKVSDVADTNGNRLVILAGVITTALPVNATITATFPNAATYRLTGDEASGVNTLDAWSGASGTGTSYASGATATTASANEFVFGAVALYAGSSPTWAAGWTAESVYSSGTTYLGRAYKIPGSTGSFNATGTASGNWLAVCVTFR